MDKCAFDLGDMCSALNVKDCIGCGFFKTKECLQEGRKKGEERVLGLPPEEYKHIHEKYYYEPKTRKFYGG